MMENLLTLNLLAWVAQVALLAGVACVIPVLIGVKSPSTPRIRHLQVELVKAGAWTRLADLATGLGAAPMPESSISAAIFSIFAEFG